MREQIGMTATAIVMVLLFMLGLKLPINGIIKLEPKKISIEQRMETCSFPTYDQILECEKIKAIRGAK